MNDLKGKKVLLFCPVFFNYEKEIKLTLEELGAEVVWFDDRPANDFLSKSLIRINKNFLKNKIDTYYNFILKKFKDEDIQFDYLFFVNPESISKQNLEEFRKIFYSAKFLLYMWDSFENRKQNIELLPLFDAKFTFDSKDSSQYGLTLRALFYTKDYESVDNNIQLTYDILFIGTAHTDRYNLVKKLTQKLDHNKLKLYFFLSSKALFYIRKLIHKDFRSVRYEDISFQSLNHNDISKLMGQSKVILDINHPKQIGLTMRTLETLGAGRKLITTNKDILQYDFYDPSNILLIERDHQIVDSEFFKIPMNRPSQDILLKYSIKGWVMEIFNIL